MNLWLRLLGWCLLTAAGCWLLVGLISRLLGLVLPLRWFVLALVGLALVASVIGWSIRRPSYPHAACALDVAAGLRERLSTSLHCRESDDPWAQAVCADAELSADRVIIRQHAPIRWPVSMSYAVGGVLLAALVVGLTPQADLLGRLSKRRQESQRQEQLATVTNAVQATIERVKALPLDQNAADLKELQMLTDLEPAAMQDARLDPEDLRRDAVKKLQDASDAIREKMSSSRFDAAEQFKRMMRALEDPSAGDDAASKLQQSLARGDLSAAQEAIKELQKQLAESGELTDEQREALQEKLDTLARQLENLAANDALAQQLEAMNLTEEELEKLAEALEKGDKQALAEKGLTEEQVRQMLKNLQQRRQACTQCQGLASCLGMASACIGEGSGEADMMAAAQLDQAGQMLSELEAAELELDSLMAALNELEGCRSGLCGGPGSDELRFGPGMGSLGHGRGGRAPRQPTDVQLSPSKSPTETGRGAVIARWFVDGQQLKGEAQAEYNEAAGAAAAAATEALNEDRVPRQYQRAVKTYFDRLPNKDEDAGGAGSAEPAAESKP